MYFKEGSDDLGSVCATHDSKRSTLCAATNAMVW